MITNCKNIIAFPINMLKFVNNVKKQPSNTLIVLFMLLLLSISHVGLANDNIPDSLANTAILSDDDTQEANTQDSQPQAKILNLEILTNIDDIKNQTLYVGQYITISYRLVLLNDARIVYTEFNPSLEANAKQNSTNVALIKEEEWQKQGDYFIANYTFKILDTKVTIPALVVHVQNNLLQDSMQTTAINLNAQSLAGNADYSGVVANKLNVTDYNLENYDNNTNMIMIEIEAEQSNLEDFRLPHIKDQEFGQGSKFGSDLARVNIVARIPKTMPSIEFNYFDINRHIFVPFSIPNTINTASFDDEVKENLNPKTSFFRITNIIIIIVLAFSLLLTIIKRSYFWAIISCLIVGLLIYRIFSNTYSIKTLPNARVLIQPTKNSTELFVIPNASKLEAIDKKNGFYKVNIESKIGWISQTDTK